MSGADLHGRDEPRRSPRRCAALALQLVLTLTIMLASAADASAARFGDIEIEIVPALEGDAWWGYTEYRFRIENHSSERRHEVEIRLPSTPGGGYGNVIAGLGRRATVQPGARVRLEIFQPGLPCLGSGASILIDGEQQSRTLPLELQGYPGMETGGSPAPTVLLGRSASLTSSGSGRITLPESLAEIQLAYQDAADWSASWLALSRYSGLVLTLADYEELSQASRSALWGWCSAGGALLILGTDTPPDDMPEGIGSSSTAERHYSLGLGELFLSTAPTYDALQLSEQHEIAEGWSRTWEPLLVHSSWGSPPATFNAVEGLGIPVRSLFLLIVGFSLLIGPINIAVVRRLDRWLWLLWTVPAISAATAIGLLLFALIVEGWSPIVRAEGLTVLDQESRLATTIGRLAIYPPVVPSDGLHLGREVELTSCDSYRHARSDRRLDWSTDQHLERGWFQARVPSSYAWRGVSTRLERLVVREVPGGVEITNALGVAVNHLWLADEQGTVYQGSMISAGASARLHLVTWPATASATTLRELWTGDWTSLTTNAKSRVQTLLGPCSYLALVEQSPFIEVEMTGSVRRRSTGAVYGRFRCKDQVDSERADHHIDQQPDLQEAGDAG